MSRMNITKKLAGIVAALFGFVTVFGIIPAQVSADQYGGQQPSTQISLNKTVRDPRSGSFVDNLSTNTAMFKSRDEVTFQLSVQNTGNTSFGFVDVKDTLPAYLEFVSGPGTYNASTRVLSYRIENVTPGKSDVREIKARVVNRDQMPSNAGTFCVVNAASVVTNDGRTAQDTAQVCISEQVLGEKAPVKELPKTGFSEIILTGLFTGAIGAGYMLRKARY